MGRAARHRTRLRALQARVWGEECSERVARQRTRRRQRLAAVLVTGIGGQLVLTAVGLVLVSTAASAHTSTIDISCTEVEFVYQNFPKVTATAHESVVINGVEAASRDITFQGPGTTDTITIALGSGSNTVEASDHWSYNGSPQGSAHERQTLNYCHSSSTTTTAPASSSTSPSSTASTSTVPGTSTTSTSVPASSTSSTAPASSTSVPESSTTTVPSSTSTSSTSVPETSTSGSSTSTTPTSTATSTTRPGTSTTIHEFGSTTTTSGATTSSTVHELGSTTTTAHGRIPFTGSSGVPLAAALGALGVGTLAIGLGRLRRTV